ncbi:MAG: hypothetical protein K2N74_03760, partial [Clostridiales bacterium]|nr:hypothetical protein [Clostridiales bacterium]
IVKWEINGMEYDLGYEYADIEAGSTVTITAVWELNAEINLPTVTAAGWWDSRFLVEYPEKIKHGDVLTVEGTVNTTNGANVYEGIFVVITTENKDNFTFYKYDNDILKSDDWALSQAGDANKRSVGFTDYASLDWFEDYKHLIAGKQLDYKAVVDYTAHNVILVTYYLTASFAEVLVPAATADKVYASTASQHTYCITYAFAATQGEYVVTLGGENATLTNGKVVRSHQVLSEVTVSADQSNVEIGSDALNLGFTHTNPVWISNKISAGDKLEITGTLKFDTAEAYFVPIVNLFENNASCIAYYRTDDWARDFAIVGLTTNQVKTNPGFSSSLTSGGTCKITVDWTTASQIVITVSYTVDTTTATNTLTVTGMPTGASYHIGLGGEHIHYTATVVRTPAAE